MRLAEIEALPSFALLGPGFGGAPFLLLRDLKETSGQPRLLFATFEQSARDALGLIAGAAETCAVTLDGAEQEIAVMPELAGYEGRVEQIRAAIAAGDVYQVC